MVTKLGTIKRTALDEYDTARKGGVIGILLEEGDELVRVRLTDGNTQLIVGTRSGNAIRFSETNARPMGRAAHGVKAVTLEKDDEVVGMSAVREGGTLLSVTENGFGKRVNLDEYHKQNRGGKGLTSYNINAKTGPVAGIIVVDETDDMMVITSDGVIIRTNVSEIPIYSRYAQGVHVMRVGGGTRVVTVARSPHEEDEAETVLDEDGSEIDLSVNQSSIETIDEITETVEAVDEIDTEV
jgi:DNA gyrase subunit A